jgi:uncharacterized lipoprotein NlpE involved in copper resistance
MHLKKIATIFLLIFAITLVGCDNSSNNVAQQLPQKQNIVNTPVQNTPPPAVTPTVSPPATQNIPTATTDSSPTKISGPGPNGEGIKGHTDKQGVKIYHLPGDPYYNRTTHISGWFFTEKDAQAAGYRHILR